MKICIYANCQGDGVAYFMRKAVPSLDICVHRNYQLMIGEQDPAALLRDVDQADVFIYQPTDAFPTKNGEVPSTAFLADNVFRGRREHEISFAYQFNTGFFPIVKSGQWWTGAEVMARAKIVCNSAACQRNNNTLQRYDLGMLSFDCARRFAENLSEQSRREAGCSLRFAPFILRNFQTKHLFVMHNHPASALFEEMAFRMLAQIGQNVDRTPYTHPNEAGLPGYHGVHPAVIRELGLQYEPNREGEDMEFYRTLITELLATKGVL